MVEHRARPDDVQCAGIVRPTQLRAAIACGDARVSSVSTMAPRNVDRWADSSASSTSCAKAFPASSIRRGSPARVTSVKHSHPSRYPRSPGDRSTSPCSASTASARETWLFSCPVIVASRVTPSPPSVRAASDPSAIKIWSPRLRLAPQDSAQPAALALGVVGQLLPGDPDGYVTAPAGSCAGPEARSDAGAGVCARATRGPRTGIRVHHAAAWLRPDAPGPRLFGGSGALGGLRAEIGLGERIGMQAPPIDLDP